MSNPNQDPAKIRRLRIEAGLSQTELARRARVTKSHVSQVEMGKAGFGPERLARIAAALGRTVADLMPEPEAAPTVHETAGAA